MPAPHRRPVRLAAIALCAVSSAAATASGASAATLTADKPCYVNSDSAVGAPMVLSGTGYTPGASVEISGTGVVGSTTADASGNISTTIPAPILSTIGPGTMATTLTAGDQSFNGAPPATATTTVQSANLAAVAKPGSVRNVKTQKVTFIFSGFTPGRHIYGFYMRQKVVATDEFGKASGPCGVLRQRALLYPGGHPHYNRYSVAFESTSRYSRSAFPRFTGTLNIIHF
jgi:hypothetical protein